MTPASQRASKKAKDAVYMLNLNCFSVFCWKRDDDEKEEMKKRSGVYKEEYKYT